MAKTPERFIWATDLLCLKPTDTVLEIGCGVGIWAELIADRLINGKIFAVDKSEAMIAKARLRNQKFIAENKATFLNSNFLNSNFPIGHFDLIVAFNVNFFWKNPDQELIKIKNLLKPEGKLFIFWQPPFEITLELADVIIQELQKNKFEILDKQLKMFPPTSAVCIIAKPVAVIEFEEFNKFGIRK